MIMIVRWRETTVTSIKFLIYSTLIMTISKPVIATLLSHVIMSQDMGWHGLHHVHLVCSEDKADETIDFYTKVMGFDLEREHIRPDGRRAFIFGDGTYGRLFFFVIDEDGPHELLPNTQAPTGGLGDEDSETTSYQVGVHHLSWGVETEEDLEQAVEVLNEHNVPYLGPVNRSNYAYDLYFQDPNGINLELFSPGPKAGEVGKIKTEYGSGEAPSTSPDEKQVERDWLEKDVVEKGSSGGIARRLMSSYWQLAGRSPVHDQIPKSDNDDE